MLLSEETKKFIAMHGEEDAYALSLQGARYPDVDIKAAVVQIEGRQRVRDKLPTWHTNQHILYPSHLPIEQCSSEKTARYKASLVRGEEFVDLTGGMGVDCFFISQKFHHTVYVERQQELCELAEHNFAALGLQTVNIVHDDCTHYLQKMASADVIFIDPARRNSNGKKVFALSDCDPDILQMEDILLEKGKTVLVKLSPMLDMDMLIRQLHSIIAVHVISVDNECKELLAILSRQAVSDVEIHCIHFIHSEMQSFHFNRSEEIAAQCTFASAIGNYLYEPNVSLLKAGAFKLPASAYGIQKLHPNSHLYTSDCLVPQFPGRIFHVEKVGNYSKASLKNLLGGMKKANITVRNFPISATELRKKLKLKEGGDDYLFATTSMDGESLLVSCKKI
jgi:16S rRNA G966 N2-methylase RsmD